MISWFQKLRRKHKPEASSTDTSSQLKSGHNSCTSFETTGTSGETRRVRVTPEEITFILMPNQPICAAERVTLKNYSNHLIFFRTKCTNKQLIISKPSYGLVPSFSCQVIEVVVHCSIPLRVKKSRYCKRVDRLSIKWIPIRDNSSLELAAQSLKSAPNSAYKFNIPIRYKAEEKYDITESRVQKCKSAFDAVQRHVVLKGDFENRAVGTCFRLMNSSQQRIVWRLLQAPSILNPVVPKEGILKSGESQMISIEARRFHVKDLTGVHDVVTFEWTAAAKNLTTFSDICFEDAPKTYTIDIYITYDFVETGSHT